jgi:hypothetical protein
MKISSFSKKQIMKSRLDEYQILLYYICNVFDSFSEYQQYEAFRKKVFPKLGERHFVSKQIEKEDLVKRVNGILSLN